MLKEEILSCYGMSLLSPEHLQVQVADMSTSRKPAKGPACPLAYTKGSWDSPLLFNSFTEDATSRRQRQERALI